MKFALKYSFALTVAIVLGTHKLVPSPCHAKILVAENEGEEKFHVPLQDNNSQAQSVNLPGELHAAVQETTTTTTTTTSELNSHRKDDVVARELAVIITANLTNGVPLTGLSGGRLSNTYYALRNVPLGEIVTCTTSSGTGEVDFGMALGVVEYLSEDIADCVATQSSNTGTCAVGPVNDNTPPNVYIQLRGFEAYAGVTLTCSYPTSIPTLTNGVALTGLSGVTLSHDYYVLPKVPVGEVVNCTTRGSADVGLYLKTGELTRVFYSPIGCVSPSIDIDVISCAIGPIATAPTDVYVEVFGGSDYANVTLTCSFGTSSSTKAPTKLPTKTPTKSPTKAPTKKSTMMMMKRIKRKVMPKKMAMKMNMG